MKLLFILPQYNIVSALDTIESFYCPKNCNNRPGKVLLVIVACLKIAVTLPPAVIYL